MGKGLPACIIKSTGETRDSFTAVMCCFLMRTVSTLSHFQQGSSVIGWFHSDKALSAVLTISLSYASSQELQAEALQ